MSTAAKVKLRRTGAKPVRRRKPDMKEFAAHAAARLKAWYGDRVIPDSSPLLRELRNDAAG